MSSKRGSYSREFKETAVLEVIDQSRPIADVARQLELVEQTLGNWVKAYRAEHAGDGLLCKEAPVSVKFAFIAGEEGNYPIYKMCGWAKVSRSGFYEWRDRAPSATAVRRGELAALVQFAFKHSDGTSGYRRIHAQLRRWGHYFDDETIRSVMRELGLVACQRALHLDAIAIVGGQGQCADHASR